MISYYYLYKDTISKSQSQVFKALFSSVYFQKVFGINCTLLTLLKLFVQSAGGTPKEMAFSKSALPALFFLRQVDVTTQQIICISRRSIQANRFLQIDQRQIFVFHLTFHVGTGNIKSRIVRSLLHHLIQNFKSFPEFLLFCSKVANPRRPL